MIQRKPLLLTRLPLLLLTMALLALPLQLLAKQALDHSIYTEWQEIKEQSLSPDGQWLAWSMAPEERDATLVYRASDGGEATEIERGEDPRFSHDSRHLVFRIAPEREAVRQARLDEKPEEEHPKPDLGVVSLDDGQLHTFDRVEEFALPEEAGGWLAWRHAPPLPEEDEENNDENDEDQRADEKDPGTELVLLNLESGEKQRFDHVADFALSPNGDRLALAIRTPDGEGDGVKIVDSQGDSAWAYQGEGLYEGLVFDPAGEQLAFLARLQDENEDRSEPARSLHLWSADASDTRRLADEGSGFLRDDWHVSEHRRPEFSDSGERLFFGTAPDPIEEMDQEDKLDEEKVGVQVWHWQDDRLQPMQDQELEQDQKRSYLAVAHLADDNRLVQLGRTEIPDVELAMDGDAPVFMGLSNLPYQKEISWDFPRYYDAWIIDVDSGEAEMVLKAVQWQPTLSPATGHVSWWDGDQKTWFALDLDSREATDLGQAIDYRLDSHRNDRPFPNPPYDNIAWVKDDAAVLVHDRHDVWWVDPASGEARNLTAGEGREADWNFRLLSFPEDEDYIDPEQPLLATAFDEQSRDHGLFQLDLDGESSPVEQVMSAHRYDFLARAEDGDAILFTRESFQEFPDLQVAEDHRLESPRKLSEANPQQSDYRWGQVEQVSWESETGKPHEGLLFKPEDFDPEQEYPMIVYFYERASDTLHSHRPPQAHRSVIIPTFYNSNDYIVFVPDIWYREGYPGDSALEAIMPKTRALAEEPWIDADRVGIQGHSWAGYKIAYMVGHTDFFKAAAGGAPVSNMTSAYGGIRWRTGMSRMFQYERTQSRLGVTLWEDKELYLHNSPLFRADQINTPLLMMHNDEDGAVPWEQGIELFTALRRLDRPAWLINYEGEPHWPTTFANREDWQIRLQQFFDHYLKDEPAPRWLESGIPTLEKDATLGLETE
ncbi:dipeptidyl aminopeptidase/acylaminoacyl peptidase [Natronospira proteinivora]|uniref:Dipeptidyl aminopeptidase/acylaminoacyl peptidase n=1 Tax=Natronospira proteinivora TaxID=1807133 RepID=A0ABT1G936_9GAMM|nr:prolyl oligopeptidase family serine peptidase [Natronospira proteinivora]MCP1727834.1 dipeptidyl aminopeptidase/acylaminoacyl peptidase [Natronospira proteinivora]